MKTLILGLTTLAVAGASVQTATAGDREWATAGKVLTGIAAASLLSRAFEAPPVYTYQQRAYAPPPVYVVQSAPVMVAPQPVYVQSAPTVVYQQPVYVQPAPVVVYQEPVYVQPAPVYRVQTYAPVVYVGFGFGYGHSHGHGHSRALFYR